MSTIPAEWARHRAIWTAWPSAGELWGEDLEPARAEVAAMVRALWDEGRGDVMRVLANGREAEATAKLALGQSGEIVPAQFGDIWLRDTGPVFARGGALAFRFNGWGGKYVLAHDSEVADFLAHRAGSKLQRFDFVLEGGAVEMDGEGTLITTRQCLLNKNRNPDWDGPQAEAALKRALGVEKIIWLDEGLANDHTDGHIDNLARFIAPGRVVCQAPYGADDPNAEALNKIALALKAARDALGRQLEVTALPSPGLVMDEDGDAMPASHMNFVIGNTTIVVPIYSDSGDDAVRELGKLFPNHRVIGLSSHAILTGGGSYHCITQQEPA